MFYENTGNGVKHIYAKEVILYITLAFILFQNKPISIPNFFLLYSNLTYLNYCKVQFMYEYKNSYFTLYITTTKIT